MRIRISHLTSYAYGTPANSVIQMLRLTPRAGQRAESGSTIVYAPMVERFPPF